MFAAFVAVAFLCSAAWAAEEASAWTFRGFFALGDGKEYVSLSRPDHEPRWLPVGGRFASHRIASLDRRLGVVTLVTPAGEEVAVALEGATVGVVKLRPAPAPEMVATEAGLRVKLPVPAGTPPGRPAPPGSEIVDVFPAPDQVPSAEGLDWDWIQSDDNPMRKMATLPSTSETMKWAQLTPEQRSDLVELYRQCGWALTVLISRNGYIAARIRAIPPPPADG